jgi:hypothetical protein
MVVCYPTLELIPPHRTHYLIKMQSRHSEATGNEHIKLLEKIITLESNELTDANISRALHDLKLRYNEWIEAGNQRTQYRTYLEDFPTEIWVQVFLGVIGRIFYH